MNRVLGLSLACTTTLAAFGCSSTASSPNPSSAASQPSSPTLARCARRHPGVGPTRLGIARDGSAVAVVRAGARTLAYVADADDDAVYAVPLDDTASAIRTALPGAPSQVVVMADGRVAVALRDANQVTILEPTDEAGHLSAVCSSPTPVEPVGLALTPDEGSLLVTSGWAAKLTSFDTETLKPRFIENLPREPRDVVVDAEGQRAFVAHVVGGEVSVIDLDRPRVAGMGGPDRRSIDIRVAKQNVRRSGTDPLRASCQSFALAKSVIFDDSGDGPPRLELDVTPTPASVAPPKKPVTDRIFVPRVSVEPGEPTRRSSGYGDRNVARLEAPIVNVIDAGAERNLTVELTPAPGVEPRATPSGECLLPRAATMSPVDGSLLVACMGNDTIVSYDPRSIDPSRLERRRWTVPAGPRGIAVDAEHAVAVVWSQFDRKLSLLDLKGSSVETSALPRAAKSKLTSLQAKGRKLFHQTDNEQISQDGRACASCHPDGREDSLTWPTPNGARQTIMLAGRLKGSAPFSWQGAHESLHVHLDNTFQRLGGTGLDSPDMDALIAYIQVMDAPNLTGGTVAPHEKSLAARGRELFFSAEQGCASCHTGGGTDAEVHDLDGTPSSRHVQPAGGFDTPSLRFVGHSAPYFHDGRYATLMDLLTSTDSKMGHTMHLSRRDAKALAVYLETL